MRERKTEPQATRAEAGFTLLELLVVIVILGLLVAIATPALFNVLGKAKASVAKQDIDALGSQLDNYRLDLGSLPTQEQGLLALWTKPNDVENWSGPYIKSAASLKDPWNHDWARATRSAIPSGFGRCRAGLGRLPQATTQAACAAPSRQLNRARRLPSLDRCSQSTASICRRMTQKIRLASVSVASGARLSGPASLVPGPGCTR